MTQYIYSVAYILFGCLIRGSIEQALLVFRVVCFAPTSMGVNGTLKRLRQHGLGSRTATIFLVTLGKMLLDVLADKGSNASHFASLCLCGISQIA